MRPLIFVRRTHVASHFLIKDLLELANIESGKARLPEKKSCKFRPRLSS
jgi:hypothetical protein